MEREEARATLLDRVRRRTGSIPPELLVGHVLSVTRDADWPVQREAMEALIRRIAFGKDDGLTIASRPPGGALLGPYATRRKGSLARPYRTLLEGVDPIRGSCDCPDFLRSSLAICKHLIAVIEDLASKPRLWDRARLERVPAPPLRWEPVRPLLGPGDWLGQVRWKGDASAGPLRRWLRSDGGIRETFEGEPRRRLDLCEALFEHLKGRGVDPALRALVSTERARLARSIEDGSQGGRLMGTLRTLKRRLYPYQKQGVETFLSRGRLLLADDMGLGKTAQAIASCHALFHAGRIRRGLLLVPASLKPQWLREWQGFTDAPVEVVDGAPEERRRAFERCSRGFLIANYEQLVRDLEVMRGWNPDLVVLDEAQRIKNWATKTALCVKRLDPPYRLVLTGTPMENRLDELASIVEWVDDFALEPKWRLVPWHTKPVDGPQEIGGARNLETLRTRLGGCMLRRIRQEVLKDLPPRTDTRVPVELTAAQGEEHDALDGPIARLIGIAKQRPLLQAEHLKLMMLLTMQRIVSNGLAQLKFPEMWPQISKIERPTEEVIGGLSSPKLLELRELVESIAVDKGRKMVVFSQWRRMLRLAEWAVRDVLGKAGLRAAFFTGQEGPKRRTQNIVEFHDDPAVRVLFATDAGGVGLNLQHAANCCVNMELPWNPAVLEQRIGRIHRLGQKRPIDVYNLVTEEGIESRISTLVGTKQALFKGLFDGSSDEVTFERSGSFVARIERLMKPAVVPEGEGGTDREVEVGEGSDEEASPSASEVKGLFSALRVQRRPDGGMTIDAPPEAAASLAALFEGMAGMLRGASGR